MTLNQMWNAVWLGEGAAVINTVVRVDATPPPAAVVTTARSRLRLERCISCRAAMSDHRFPPRPHWYRNDEGGRVAGRPGNLERFRNVLWVSMIKFSVGAVVWVFVMYWLLSEYTNILA